MSVSEANCLTSVRMSTSRKWLAVTTPMLKHGGGDTTAAARYCPFPTRNLRACFKMAILSRDTDKVEIRFLFYKNLFSVRILFY